VSPSVAVLLSTYNGGPWLAAQLDSLAEQVGVDVDVLARDDGSRDDTREILARYADRWPRLAGTTAGPNLGPAMSFLTLLEAAPDGFDGYAFCDQDDVWPPQKLARACRALAGAGGPALYCSQVMCVDADLRPLGPAPVKDDPRFEHLLFENIAFGVTLVMNAAAARLVRSRPPQQGVIMHDWWCALVVSAFGQVIYDPEPGVLYRQHGGNEVGQGVSRIGELARQARRLRRDPGRFWPAHAQAREFLRLWGEDLAPPQRALVQAFVASKRSLGARLAYAATGPILRERFADAVIARALVAAGLY
jgi:glycosyltransferase involved in cell wall biosynthesis